MLYLTFNDAPSGIFYSQVTDTCTFIRNELDEEVDLLSFISARGFFRERKKIKTAFPGARVIPMFPGVANWKKNSLALSLFLRMKRPRVVIARGPFATNLVLALKPKVWNGRLCFDARGAYHSEFNEYDVSGSDSLRRTIGEVEKNAVMKADIRLSVSGALVNYWIENYNYVPGSEVVIPCTLGNDFEKGFSRTEAVTGRRKLGFADHETVLAYSGSAAGWQSLQGSAAFISALMEKNAGLRLLVLTPGELPAVLEPFRARIICKWVNAPQVRELLLACDYGLLLRERSVTNKVSSPVKFAEYLSCGLKVLMTNAIEDSSAFVNAHNAGSILDLSGPVPLLEKPPQEEKERMSELAAKYFRKRSFTKNYKLILHA